MVKKEDFFEPKYKELHAMASDWCPAMLRLCIAAALCLGLALPFAYMPAVFAAEPGAAPNSPPGSSSDYVPIPEPSEKAVRYYRSGNVLWLVDQVWSVVVPLGLVFMGIAGRLQDWARRKGKYWYLALLLFFLAYLLISYVLNLPLSFYAEYIRQHAYGLSNQTFGKWFGDSLKALLVSAVMGAIFLWIPMLLLKRSPRRWWLYTGLLSAPFFCFVMWIYPVFVDPLFNRFGPLQDKALEHDILALASKVGIHGGRVYQVDKSTDTKMINAYVTGFLGTKRIVLWDTLLQKMERDQILFVMAHEMGHYVLNHVVLGILFYSALVLLALYLVFRLGNTFVLRWGQQTGITALSDIAALPLLAALLSIVLFLCSPIALAFSRHLEHEADRFALEVTRNNRAAALAFLRLQEENLAVPQPGWLFKLWRASHPTLAERITFSNTYRPWEQGKPLKYERYFISTAPSQDLLRPSEQCSSTDSESRPRICVAALSALFEDISEKYPCEKRNPAM